MRVIFTKTHSTINGNDNFFSDNIDFAPANVKFKRKYEKKLRGISEPFIMASGNAVDPVCLPRQLFSPKTASFYQNKSF